MTVVKLDLQHNRAVFVTMHSFVSSFSHRVPSFFLVHLLKIRSVPGILIAMYPEPWPRDNMLYETLLKRLQVP